jgi:hypothetical protein
VSLFTLLIHQSDVSCFFTHHTKDFSFSHCRPHKSHSLVLYKKPKRSGFIAV